MTAPWRNCERHGSLSRVTCSCRSGQCHRTRPLHRFAGQSAQPCGSAWHGATLKAPAEKWAGLVTTSAKQSCARRLGRRHHNKSQSAVWQRQG